MIWTLVNFFPRFICSNRPPHPNFFPPLKKQRYGQDLQISLPKSEMITEKKTVFPSCFTISILIKVQLFLGFVTVGEVTTNLYLTFFIKNVFHFIGNPLLIHSRVVQTKIKSVQVLVSFTFCYLFSPGFKNGIVLVDLKKKSSNCNPKED